MKTYKEMNRQEIGAAYDNTSAVANSTQLLDIYQQRSQEVRKNFKHTKIDYGKGERQNIDYFHIKDNAPIFVFIHGGYWQMRRKETFHFLVDFIAKQGLNVAFIGYTLAPQNNIKGIETELFEGLKILRQNSADLLFDKDNIIISGWSAGGHLSVELIEAQGIVSAIAISGIYDLEPIQQCFLNDKLNITSHDIQNLSPMKKSSFSKRINIVYGESELPEIIRQSKEFYKYCKNLGVEVSIKEMPTANHFSILLDENTFKI